MANKCPSCNSKVDELTLKLIQADIKPTWTLICTECETRLTTIEHHELEEMVPFN